MRTISIEVNGDASVMFDGVLLGSTTPAPNVAAEADDSLRHDTPREVQIAAMCHELNRQYCKTLGDHSQLPWSKAPGWQQASAISGVRGIESGAITKPEDSHNAWMAEKKDAGWVYGPQKSEVAKTHPCIVPYGQLSPEQRKKDRLFFAIATAMLATE